MNLTVSVTWKGATAYYTLEDDAYRVFECRLQSYEGAEAEAPPAFMLLVRAGDHWIGSHEPPLLAEELGRCIESGKAFIKTR